MHPVLRLLVPARLSDRARSALRLAAVSLMLGIAVPGAAAVAHGHIKGPLLAPKAEPAPVVRDVLVYEGLDMDGDGQPDFQNPTGLAPRDHDDFGDGWFGASRDGGGRRHEGVDYAGVPGQAVAAPISGYVSKIGMAYADDRNLEFIEITNPALGFTARVFYVTPGVQVGDAVHLGDAIGSLDSLQDRYPGITNHVHLEMMQKGRRFDAQAVIVAHWEKEAVSDS